MPAGISRIATSRQDAKESQKSFAPLGLGVR
jgi:hypothetical protein